MANNILTIHCRLGLLMGALEYALQEKNPVISVEIDVGWVFHK